MCDQNLGKLAKWLRILGFDTELMSRWDNDAMMKAVKAGRIVLSRKVAAAPNRGILFIRNDRVREQLKEVLASLDLRKDIKPFRRCSLCNALLINVPREEVKDSIPEYVYATRETFARCPSCGRVYWKGTHFSRACDMINSLLKDAKT
ncbi:MAG TPA: Mut7-C RNAse domain-containing protein [Desulfomonilia bacterium]|nr:Mut7-C RNAse domain-containing protein [Desulfomonilia bacterium]